MSESVKSAVRTLRILELFDAAEKPLGLKQITSQLNLPKSSAFMLVNTLLNEGYLEESEKNTFKLTAVLKENSIKKPTTIHQTRFMACCVPIVAFLIYTTGLGHDFTIV